MWLFGELEGATVILYELAPETLVHLSIVVLDVAENTVTSIPPDERDDRSRDHRSTCLITLTHGLFNT